MIFKQVVWFFLYLTWKGTNRLATMPCQKFASMQFKAKTQFSAFRMVLITFSLVSLSIQLQTQSLQFQFWPTFKIKSNPNKVPSCQSLEPLVSNRGVAIGSPLCRGAVLQNSKWTSQNFNLQILILNFWFCNRGSALQNFKWISQKFNMQILILSFWFCNRGSASLLFCFSAFLLRSFSDFLICKIWNRHRKAAFVKSSSSISEFCNHASVLQNSKWISQNFDLQILILNFRFCNRGFTFLLFCFSTFLLFYFSAFLLFCLSASLIFSFAKSEIHVERLHSSNLRPQFLIL
jgi:hypothetical protein